MVLNVIDYGLGLTTLSQSNLPKLDRVQNEAMRVVLGTTKDTPVRPCATYWTCHSWKQDKMEQAKAYLDAMQNPKNPLHDAVKEEKGCRLARGKSWMGQVDQSNQHVRNLAELKKKKKRKKKKRKKKRWTGKNVQVSSSPTPRVCCHRI